MPGHFCFNLATRRGTGCADPLTSSVAGTRSLVHPDPPVVGIEAGSEPDLSSDPGAVKVILGGV